MSRQNQGGREDFFVSDLPLIREIRAIRGSLSTP